jgi:type IV pilus assembly protein PilA
MGRNSGFSLIELMIVVAIISVLAAMAIPMYQNYVTRARWQDNITTTQQLNLAIAACLTQNSGDAAHCQTLAELELSEFPSPPFGVLTPPVGSGIGAGQSTYVITGTPEVGSCVVTVVGSYVPSVVQWVYSTSGVGCTRKLTGVGS